MLPQKGVVPQRGVVWGDLPWKVIIPRLMLFARHLRSRKPFAGADSSPEDLVLSAIEKTITGNRQWDVENVGIIEHIMQVVSSDLYNSVRKQLAFRNDEMLSSAADELASEEPSPEETAISKSEARNLLAFLESRDERLAQLASLSLLFGATRANELAALMHL